MAHQKTKRNIFCIHDTKVEVNREGFRITSSASNCKLVYLDTIQPIIEQAIIGNNSEHLTSLFNEVRQRTGKIAGLITLSRKEHAQYILNNFEVYSYTQVEIGYSHAESLQYHLVIRLPGLNPNHYPLNQQIKTIFTVNKETAKNTLTEKYGEKRQKK